MHFIELKLVLIIIRFCQDEKDDNMNKSIAKTRNQLQRITYKINQLKNKYTGQTGRPYLNNFENSPISATKNQGRRQINAQVRAREPKEIHQNTQQSQNKNNTQNRFQNESLADLRNQIFAYVQKCMVSVKQRQDQLVYMMSNREKQFVSEVKNCNQDRLKKIQEQLTECISNIQNLSENQLKNEKEVEDQIANVQYLTKRDIQKLKIAVQSVYNERNIQGQRRIEDFIQVMEELQHEINQLGQWKKEAQESIKTLHEELSHREAEKQSRLQQLIPKLISDVVKMEREQIQNELQSKIKNNLTEFGYESVGQIKRLEQKLVSQRERSSSAIKKIQKIQQEIKENRLNLQSLIFKFENNKSEGQPKRAYQYQQMLSTKLSQMKQQLIQLGDQLNRQGFEHLTNKIESLLFQGTENQRVSLEAHIEKILKQIQQTKSQKKQTNSGQGPSGIIDEKLNEFENDINETIRLLYQDIDQKVSQTIANSGISQVKSEIDSIKKQNLSLETTIKSLTILVTEPKESTNSTDDTKISNLRLELYQDMGCQIEKLSQLLETAIQQMEVRIEKLQHNFSYTYQQMSKIQYDNASFKDQINTLLDVKTKSLSLPQLIHQLSFDNMNGNKNQLDLLGSYPGLI